MSTDYTVELKGEALDLYLKLRYPPNPKPREAYPHLSDKPQPWPPQPAATTPQRKRPSKPVLYKRLTLKLAKEITGHITGLGKPSKMPGFSTATSAEACITGRKLAKVPGSPCADCYALKGNYQYPSVQLGHKRRLAALANPLWVEGMARLIGHYTDPQDPYFRIHDSGDFQSVEHVLMWVDVAERLPWVEFWVPTQERLFLSRARIRLGRTWPSNLVVRVSSTKVGQAQTKGPWPTSSVDSGVGHGCPAPKQGGKCGSCRACWDPKVSNVDYHKH